PRPAQMLSESIMPDRPCDQNDGYQSAHHAAEMPKPGDWIAFMNVPPDGVGLITKDEAERLLDLAEVLLRIDAHQGARRTILFARICRARRAGWIQRGRFAEIAFDRDHVLAFGRQRRRRCRAET